MRHEDVEIAERHVTIVPRDNDNRARAKTVTEARQLPSSTATTVGCARCARGPTALYVTTSNGG